MPTDSPAPSQAGKHPRLASLARTNDLGSPARSSSRQQLGAIGGRSGPGYSPYARRVATRAAAQLAPDSGDDDDARDDDLDAGDDDAQRAAQHDPSPTTQSKGLFGKVRSLPGRMLGMLSRSSSSKQLAAASSSSSLAQVRAELDQVRAKDNQGLSRSHTSHNLAAPRLNPLSAGPAPLPASSSMSALSSFAQPHGGRSSHSTLRLPPNTASANGSTGAAPSFLTAANLGRHSTRAASPAPSTASLATRQQRNRSPSPLRTGLAGSMSAFQLAQPASPTSASAIFNHPSSALNAGAVANPFGLSSRSPFASSRIRPSPSVGAGGSIAGFSASSAAGSAGHPLFPYASTLPRGTSPGLTSSFSLREGLSGAASASASGSTVGGAGATLKRPYARAMGGSPLGPRFPASVADVEMRGEPGSVGGAERARKKQLVWDPVQGLVSRERLEQEKAAEAPALPKNEAERILEVLEGMGRTPLGDAKRASVRPKHVNVPATSLDSSNGRLPRSSTTPSILSSTPYAARSARLSADPTEVASSSSRPQQKGLQAVLRAREERRRALLEQEREERERERVREQRRRDRRRRMDELAMISDDGEGDTDVFSAGGSTRASRSQRGGGSEYGDDDELRSPRRVTRSAAKKPSASSSTRDKGKGKDRLLEPPTPSASGSRRSTRASSRTSTSSAKAGAGAKSPSPAPTPRKSSRSARVDERDEQEDQDEDDAEMTPAPKRSKAKSPARSTAPKSPSPAPPVPSRESSTAPGAAPKISFPAPSSFPSTAPSTASGRSSLRPGKSHSSRQHQSSSKVFSAKEEDLPPLDDDALSKIQMPAIKFPANFSFGAGAAAPPAASIDDKKKDESAPASGSSLLSRLGAPPASSSSAAAEPSPAFSFGASAAKPAAPPVPSFSFQPSTTTSSDKKDDSAKSTAAAAPASSDFFAKPSPAPPKPAFSFTDASSSRASSVASDGTAGTAASKPNFFGHVIKAKEGDAPPPVPAITFGAPAATKKEDDKATKPTEFGASSAGADKPAGENPFALGKPVAQLVEEGKEDKSAEGPQVAAPTFMFGSSTPKPVEKKDEEKKDAPAPSLFSSFGAAKPAATSSSATFSFGGPAASAPAADKPKTSSSFSFGSSTPGSAAAPSFQFGTTPATPQADEKKDAPAAPTFGAGLAPAIVPAATTDEAGDSGMEDEGTPEPSKPAPAPAPFAFGASSSGTGAAPSLFGGAPAPSSGAFNFGGAPTAEKKEPSSALFGAPASSSSTGPGMFGAAASTPKPAFTFGASPSPSPAPPSPAPTTGPGFSFGTSTAPTNGSSAAAPSPFTFTFGASAPTANVFGSTPTSAPGAGFGAAPAPFKFGGASPSPAPASPAAVSSSGFNFGAPTAPAMGSSFSNGAGAAAPTFAFGSQPTTPGAAPSAAPFQFGSPAPTPGAAATQAFQFGATPAGGAPSPFGAPPAANGAASPFVFGAPSATGGEPPAGSGFVVGSGGGETAKTTRPTRGLPSRRKK
ncbi:hypothetical protein JCM8208_001505 [Rhodotorula glutinis]